MAGSVTFACGLQSPPLVHLGGAGLESRGGSIPGACVVGLELRTSGFLGPCGVRGQREHASWTKHNSPQIWLDTSTWRDPDDNQGAAASGDTVLVELSIHPAIVLFVQVGRDLGKHLPVPLSVHSPLGRPGWYGS